MFGILLITLFITVVFTIIYISRRKYNYWKKKNVPFLEPTSVLGNYGEFILLKKYMGSVVSDILSKFPNEPYVGAYYGTEPVLIVQDPEIIKVVTMKDFYYFHGREVSKYATKELVTQNLFFAAGDDWKVTRQNLTPLFSSAKMKNMYHLIKTCSVKFEKNLDRHDISTFIDVRGLLARYTMACICSCAFGVDVDTLGKDVEENPFIAIGDLLFESSTIRGCFNIARSVWPALFYGVGLNNFPAKIELFFKTFLTKVFEGRGYKPTTREDFIDLVLSLKNKETLTGDSIHNSATGEKKRIEIPVTNSFMISQCLIFFGAGYETSATTLSFTLFELAKHTEEQRKVQKEIDEFLKKHDNQLTYACVSELPYTEACIDEAMRLYPVLGVITREVMETYTLPSGLTLDKGVRVHLPALALHTNPEYFPEPEIFRPERFYGEQKKNIQPHTYMPFGDGGRICIGARFAKMQMLSGLVTILKKFHLELADGMPSKLQFNPRSIVTQPYGGINLKFTPRNGWEDRVFVNDPQN